MVERDYIMRLVQQLAAALTRIFKLKEQEKYEQALDETGSAFNELLGMSPELMAAFDSATLAQLLGHHQRVKTAAALFRAEGELYQRKGEEAVAQARYQRAFELYLEAAQMQEQSDAECVEAIRLLAKLLFAERIATNYADLMQKLVR
ncbi:hypothetical protein HUU05_21425 [candidate division KSB1 bacterium]|nr:hypothetical protein [candidate division KSB1 bacterium]